MTSVSHSPLSLEGVGAQKNEKNGVSAHCVKSSGGWESYKVAAGVWVIDLSSVKDW